MLPQETELREVINKKEEAREKTTPSFLYYRAMLFDAKHDCSYIFLLPFRAQNLFKYVNRRPTF